MEEINYCCCFGCETRTWAKIIAWIQIVLFTLGVLLVGGALILVLVADKDAVHKVTIENPGLEKTQHSDNSNSKAELSPFFSEYVKLVIVLAVWVVILVLGIILAALLIKGVNESKRGYLRMWIIHAVVSLAWSIVTEALDREGPLYIVLRISVSSSLYGVCIWVVVRLIKQIEAAKQVRERNSV